MTVLTAAEYTPRTRPITLAILAMGGEGGGVLSDWLVHLAQENGWYAQSTSVPGVAQRTGATVYYVELFPKLADGGYPVLGTMPTPGEVDIVVTSELMEAGRAIQRGFVTPELTTLIASTSRTYAMPERMAMGDGRVDSTELLEAAKSASRRFVRGDFARIADQTGSVISAVLFGAIAAAQVLPFDRVQFEATIKSGGKGIDASLRAFDEGFRVAAASEREVVGLEIGVRPAEAPARDDLQAVEDPNALVGRKLQAQATRIANEFPVQARWMLVNGIKRTAEYQDVKYADEYLNRVATVVPFESNGSYELTVEVARATALWMTYEDTIRVAFHKTRAKRFAGIRSEARVKDDQQMQVHEFLHPQMEEISDTAPAGVGRWLRNSKTMNKLVHTFTHKGIKLQTTSVFGYTTLYVMARMQPMRRRSLRFGIEQGRIDAWLDLVRQSAAVDYALAVQITELAGLIKGYGETHANGLRNFTTIVERVPALIGTSGAAEQVAAWQKAALADETGQVLQKAL